MTEEICENCGLAKEKHCADGCCNFFAHSLDDSKKFKGKNHTRQEEDSATSDKNGGKPAEKNHSPISKRIRSSITNKDKPSGKEKLRRSTSEGTHSPQFAHEKLARERSGSEGTQTLSDCLYDLDEESGILVPDKKGCLLWSGDVKNSIKKLKEEFNVPGDHIRIDKIFGKDLI